MGEHLQEVADYVTGDDNSELAKTKAELAYALHCLEREISICAETQKQNEALMKALEKIACRHVTINPLWWQLEAREAIALVNAPVGNAGGGS